MLLPTPHSLETTCWQFFSSPPLPSTGCGHGMPHRKWKETKQQRSMLPGPAVPCCCFVYFHFLWAILWPHTVHTLLTKNIVKGCVIKAATQATFDHVCFASRAVHASLSVMRAHAGHLPALRCESSVAVLSITVSNEQYVTYSMRRTYSSANPSRAIVWRHLLSNEDRDTHVRIG